ncbi:MAG: four helix bundle protein [Pyrinomonadaceae bacterium]
MKDFRKLAVWQKSHELALAVYSVTGTFPREEMFGLTSQLRRATASIPANIAEGCGKATDSDFARFLQIAFGSACEVEYHLILSRDLRYIGGEKYEELNTGLVEIKRMLASLISTVRAER